MKTVKIDLESTRIFRKATSYDIVQGNIVFMVTDNNELVKEVIEEVLNPTDDFKAFVSDDGCRYGLHDLWVLTSNKDYLSQLHEVTDKLIRIKKIVNSQP
jgi:hypothetical protein